MLTVALALAAPFVGFAGAFFLIAQFYFRNTEMRTFATILGAGILAVLAVLAIMALNILIGGTLWMLAIKLVAWIIDIQLSWALAFLIGAVITVITTVIRSAAGH
ncbi:hypothetical protein [Labrys neptuniae]